MKRWVSFLFCAILLCGMTALSEPEPCVDEIENMIIGAENGDQLQAEGNAASLYEALPDEVELPEILSRPVDSASVEQLPNDSEATDPVPGRMAGSSVEPNASGGLYINEVNIPDAAFRRYLRERVDGGEDDYLSSEEIARVTEMDLECTDEKNHVLTDMTGIEHFKSLEILHVGPFVCEIDMRGNPNLRELRCTSHAHDLVRVDVTGCPRLERLYISDSPITELELSGCPALKTLTLQDDYELSHIDLSHNPLLEELSIDAYFDERLPLYRLDLSHNPELTSVDVSGQSLTELDLSGNPKLRFLDCKNTLLKSLDVSKNEQLEYLYVSSTAPLARLKLGLKPKLESLYLQELYELKRVAIGGCPYLLSCYEAPSEYWTNIEKGEYCKWVDVPPTQIPINLCITPGMEINTRDVDINYDEEGDGKSLVLVGKKLSLGVKEKASLLSEESGYAAGECTFKSSDKTIASVSKKGVVTGKKAGKATITVKTRDGKASAKCKVTVTAKKALTDLSNASVSIQDAYFTGSALKPKVTVKLNGTKLKQNTDYSVEYKDNIDPGSASVCITGKGKYTGSIIAYFEVLRGYAVMVSFDANGGQLKDCDRGYKWALSTYGDLPWATRKGYSWEGWYTKPKGGKCVTGKTDLGLLPKDHTLYAHWSKAYSIKYVLNDNGDALNHPDNPDTFTSKASVKLAAPYRRGYDFTGWYTSKKLTPNTKISQIKKGTKKNITVYAGWEKHGSLSDKKRNIYILCMGAAENTENDIKLAAKYLKKNKLSGYTIKKTVIAYADWPTRRFYDYYFQKAFEGTTSNDLSFVYLHGHGQPDDNDIGIGLCLRGKDDPFNYPYLDVLKTLTSNIKGQIVFLPDVCYSGGFVKTAREQSFKGRDRIHIISSSAIDQESKDVTYGFWSTFTTIIQWIRENGENTGWIPENDAGYGAYTAALVNGLKNNVADTDGNGISLLELSAWIRGDSGMQEKNQKVEMYSANKGMIIYQ